MWIMHNCALSLCKEVYRKALLMSQLMDYTRYIVEQIGPRPAGSEEERQTALFITEQIQREAGFSANIEEFQRTTNIGLSHTILAVVIILATVLAMFVSALTIPAFVIVAAAACVYVLEVMGTPLLARMLGKGASQNVVAKYQPNPENEGSSKAVSRKIILVAHYDSGRVKSGISKRLERLKLPLDVLGAGAAVAAAVLGLLRIFIAISGGGALVILNVLSAVALIVCLLPALDYVLSRRAPLNEGANNNATGSAALIEIARRISSGSVSEADLASYATDVTIHGAAAAASAGLVPEGATLEYQAAATGGIAEGSEEERLLAAKAAIAALTGKPVERRVFSSLSEKPIAADEPAVEPVSLAGVPGVEAGADASAAGAAGAAGAAVEAAEVEGVVQVIAGPSSAEGQPEAPVPGMTVTGSFEAVPDEEFAAAFTEWTPGSSSVTSKHAPIVIDESAEVVAEAPVASNAVNEPIAMPAAAPAATPAPAPAPAPEEEEQDAGGFHNAPSWFIAAQKNARRSPAQKSEVHRSRFTEAMEHAERERNEHERAIQEEREAQARAEREAREAEARAALEEKERETREAAAAQAEAVAEAEAHLDDPTRAMATPVAEEVVVEAAVEVESAGTTATAPARGDGAQPAAPERAVQAELISEETISDASSDASAGQPARETPAARVSGIPAIDEVPVQTATAEEPPKVDRLERLRSLRNNVPSLSGVIRTKDEARKAAVRAVPDILNKPVSMDSPAAEGDVAAEAAAAVGDVAMTDGTVAAGATAASAAPASASAQTSVEAVDYDMEVPSDFNSQMETDFAANLVSDYADEEYGESFDDYARGEIEEPKRGSGFFSRFRHKRQTEEEVMESPQEWLGVDDDFDARSVGRARGGWESFRDDSYDDAADPFASDGFDSFGDIEGDSASKRRRGRRNWEGGASSRMSLGYVDMRSGEDAVADVAIEDLPPEAVSKPFVTGEIERIYHFRNPAFNTEVWFVAIGSDDDLSHDGIEAFLAEHKAELRGSMAIDVESLGAGELSVATREGATKKISASSRIKRYTRDAVTRTGLALGEVDLSGTESIASIIQKAGFQSMHLFGAENGRPALKGSPDDVMANVDELLLEDNVNFVYELLKR